VEAITCTGERGFRFNLATKQLNIPEYFINYKLLIKFLYTESYKLNQQINTWPRISEGNNKTILTSDVVTGILICTYTAQNEFLLYKNIHLS
jgi:hypothetical protein